MQTFARRTRIVHHWFHSDIIFCIHFGTKFCKWKVWFGIELYGYSNHRKTYIVIRKLKEIEYICPTKEHFRKVLITGASSHLLQAFIILLFFPLENINDLQYKQYHTKVLRVYLKIKNLWVWTLS